MRLASRQQIVLVGHGSNAIAAAAAAAPCDQQAPGTRLTAAAPTPLEARESLPAATPVWFAFIIVSQRVEDYVLQPLVHGRAAKQNRLGAAIPTAAAIQIVLREWWSARRLKAERIGSDEGAC